jgi:hypothetical protein
VNLQIPIYIPDIHQGRRDPCLPRGRSSIIGFYIASS